jgi:hypothetical protein
MQPKTNHFSEQLVENTPKFGNEWGNGNHGKLTVSTDYKKDNTGNQSKTEETHDFVRYR